MWNWCLGIILASAVLGASGQEGQVRAKRLTTFGKTAPVPSQPPSTVGIVVGAGKGGGGTSTAIECSSVSDCEPIQYTACKPDPRDGRYRCLCMDNSPPINGACSARPRDTRGYVPLGIRRPNKVTIIPIDESDKTIGRPPDLTLFWPNLDDGAGRGGGGGIQGFGSSGSKIEMETPLPMPSSQVPIAFRPWIRKPPQPELALRSPCNLDTECIEGAECVINPNATVNHHQRMCYCMPGWIEIDNMCNGTYSQNTSASSILVFIFSIFVILTFSS